MAEQMSVYESSLVTGNVPRFYQPSWLDRINGWLRERAVPVWGIYLSLWLLLLAVHHLIEVQGGRRFGDIFPFHAFFTCTIPFILALIYYQDQWAGRALDTFRPALTCTDIEYAALRYRFTTMPQRPMIAAGIGGALVALVLLSVFPIDQQYEIFQVARTLPSTEFNIALAVIMFTLEGILAYHTIRQLVQVNRIYTKYTRINLFQQQPLYALSGLAARTTLALLVWSYGWYGTAPELQQQPAGMLTGLFVGAMAIAALILPLNGIHRLLLGEKGRLLGQCHQKLLALHNELHRRLDAGDLASMDALNKGLASLEIERNAVLKTPTWPWQPETLRWVIAALLFPVIVWILQQVLQRVLGV